LNLGNRKPGTLGAFLEPAGEESFPAAVLTPNCL
jgi:hypothetical protein